MRRAGTREESCDERQPVIAARTREKTGDESCVVCSLVKRKSVPNSSGSNAEGRLVAWLFIVME